VAATPTVQSSFTICFIGVADRASVVVDLPLPTPESSDFHGAYAATDDRLLNPELLGKIVGARDRLLSSEEIKSGPSLFA
jgi:hypothetical protein